MNKETMKQGMIKVLNMYDIPWGDSAIDKIINTWADQNVTPKMYMAGTWGPPAANALVARDGFNWHEEL